MATWISIDLSSFTQTFNTPDSFSKSINPHVRDEFQSKNVSLGNIPLSDTSSQGESIVKLYINGKIK